MDGSKTAATEFLTSLLSKTLRITTSDTRLFVGEFKCTDADRNIILSRTYEYRLPSPPTAEAEAEAEADDLSNASSDKDESNTNNNTKITQDLTSRYLGLVVVPGEFITKIEIEEFASQVKAVGGSTYARMRGEGEGEGSV